MTVKLKYVSDNPLYDVHTYDVDFDANHIYLMGHDEYAGQEFLDTNEPGVEFAMANRFIRNLNLLMRKSDEPILIHMKTCGGHWSEGMAIYDAIRSCPNNVCILNYTHARSMSSIIFQAADKRVMMPNSTFMFHEGAVSMEGTAKQFQTEAKECKKTSEIMLGVYADSLQESGKMKEWTRTKIKAWLKNQMDKREEVYLNAAQAVEHGFADEIFGEGGEYDWESLLKFE